MLKVLKHGFKKDKTDNLKVTSTCACEGLLVWNQVPGNGFTLCIEINFRAEHYIIITFGTLFMNLGVLHDSNVLPPVKTITESNVILNGLFDVQ